MNQHLKTFLMVTGLVILIGGAVLGYRYLSTGMEPQIDMAAANDDAETPSGQAEKIKAPDFSVVDMAGNEIKLSDMLGKPVVLNFWASWCPPCKGEMPAFDTVYQELGNDVVFMMVNLTDGTRETREKAADYISTQGYSFPVYLDTEQDAAYAYGIRSIPTTLFIDKDGYVAAMVQQAIDQQTLRKGIELISPAKPDSKNAERSSE